MKDIKITTTIEDLNAKIEIIETKIELVNRIEDYFTATHRVVNAIRQNFNNLEVHFDQSRWNDAPEGYVFENVYSTVNTKEGKIVFWAGGIKMIANKFNGFYTTDQSNVIVNDINHTDFYNIMNMLSQDFGTQLSYFTVSQYADVIASIPDEEFSLNSAELVRGCLIHLVDYFNRMEVLVLNARK